MNNDDVAVEAPLTVPSVTSVEDGSTPDDDSHSHGKRSEPTSARSHPLYAKSSLIEEEESTDALDAAGIQRATDAGSGAHEVGSEFPSGSSAATATAASFDDSEPKKYLDDHVFPTLLPGIEMLLKKIKRKDGHLDEDTTDPVNWLAQYLMRHNPLAPKVEHEDDQFQFGRTTHTSGTRGAQKSASTTA